MTNIAPGLNLFVHLLDLIQRVHSSWIRLQGPPLTDFSQRRQQDSVEFQTSRRRLRIQKGNIVSKLFLNSNGKMCFEIFALKGMADIFHGAVISPIWLDMTYLKKIVTV